MSLKIKVCLGVVLAAGAVAVWRLDWRPAKIDSVAPNDAIVEAVRPQEAVVGQRIELEPEAQPVEGLEEGSAFLAVEEGVPSFGEPVLKPTRKGRVIGLDGAGLIGVPVVFGHFGQAGKGDPVVSGPGGWFEVRDAPESGQIDAVGSEWATVFQPRVLDGQKDLPVLVVAPAIALGGTVHDELGNPVADAWVVHGVPGGLRARLDVIIDESHTREWKARSDLNGRFDFEVAPAIDAATLTVRHPLFDETEQKAPIEDALAIEIVVKSSAHTVASLTGRVVDEEGTAIPDAAVVLGDASAYADSRGEFALHLQRAHDARALQVCARGLLPTTVEGQAGAGVEFAFPDPLIVVLAQSASKLRGRVIGASGAPAAGVAVWTPDEEEFGSFRYDPEDPDSWTLERTVESIARDEKWNNEVKTDAEGRFVLEGLQSRPYTVAAFDHGRFLFGVSAPTAPGDDVEVQLEEEAPRVDVTGRITSLAGAPLADVELSFTRRIVYSSRNGAVDDERRGFDRLTDADGRFEVIGLPASASELYIGGGGLASSFGRELDLAHTHHYEYALPLLCRMQVVLSDNLGATHLNLLDADGETLAVRQKHGWVEYARHRIELDGGRSEVLRTSENAQTLVIYNGEEELLRMPLTLDPNELTIVRP